MIVPNVVPRPPARPAGAVRVSNGCDVWVRATCRGELRLCLLYIFRARRTTVRNTIQHVLFYDFVTV